MEIQKAEQEADITIVMPQMESNTSWSRQKSKLFLIKMISLGADVVFGDILML